MSKDTGKIRIVKSGIDQHRREVLVMRTRNSQSHQQFIAWVHLILLAGLLCVWGPSAQAGFVLQTKGLQAQARPGTLLHGQIRLLNGDFNEPQKVYLNIVELITTIVPQWQSTDPNGPIYLNGLKDAPKTQSCMKWIDLPQTKITIEPVDLVTVPVDIRISQDVSGLYRAAIVVSIPPSRRLSGAVTEYHIVIPVLIEVKDEGIPTPLEPEVYAVEINPEPIVVKQDTHGKEPYRTYLGCRKADVLTTLLTRLNVMINAGTSPAGGSWGVTVTPSEIHGKIQVEICAKGDNVQIERLTEGLRGATIARITIQMIPDLSNWPFFWHNVE